MKVALIHDHVGGPGGGGGGVRQMLGLARGLLELGCEVTIVCHDFDARTDLAAIAEDVEVRGVHHGEVEGLPNQRAVWRRMFRGMRRVAELVPSDADVVNAHEWPAVRAGRLSKARLRVPFVWTRNDDTMFERGLFPSLTTFDPGSVPSRLLHLAYGLPDLSDGRRADSIVVLDSQNARLASRVYRRPVRVVRSGPAPQFFDPPTREEARARLGIPLDVPLAVAVGIMFPHRRFEDVVDAIAEVDGDLRARIVGFDGYDPGYANRVVERVRRRGLEQRVTVTRESVPEEELRALYAAADVFVFANERQTWGLAPLEALAARTPVIVSAGAGVHEVLEGRPGVRVVPPRSPEAIAAALRDLIPSDSAAVEATADWVATALSRRKYAEGMLAIFEEVLR